MKRQLTRLAIALLAAAGLVACGDDPGASTPEITVPQETAGAEHSASSTSDHPAIPQPDFTDMEPRVERQLRKRMAAIEAKPESAEAWGRFGMVAHAHELWQEAQAAYRQAQILAPKDERWPYFLGDVLTVVGTDPEAAISSLRRALHLRPGYAPAHMRLGRALIAADRSGAAKQELERALELEPNMQPASVSLAQIELAAGNFEQAESLLDGILASSPRHAQALSTLGQVYMRQGRRDDAREVASRARDAALYNLFSDPMMGEVVKEGVSSVLMWEAAKAYLDNGKYEQAARGLEEVSTLLADNADVHHQLAIAYGHLGQTDRARTNLEKAVALDDELVEPRVRLATVHLDQQRPQAALPLLRRALELAPEDPDAGWLLGRALVLTGDLQAGLDTFERAQRTAGDDQPVPPWADKEWGSALAQTGQIDQALAHFKRALDTEPGDAQALFYTGLALEGLGRLDEAAEYHCRSLTAQHNPPAAGRLQALGRPCPAANLQ